MTDKPAPSHSSSPSPWARRMHARLKRLFGQTVAAIERRNRTRLGPKPWRGKKRKPAAAQT